MYWCVLFRGAGLGKMQTQKQKTGGGPQYPASELTSNGDAVVTAQLLQFLLLSFSFLSQLLFLLPLPLLVLSFPLKPGSLLLLLLPSLLVEDRLLKGRRLGQTSSILATRGERDCSATFIALFQTPVTLKCQVSKFSLQWTRENDNIQWRATSSAELHGCCLNSC